jgi:hypothetical protein
MTLSIGGDEWKLFGRKAQSGNEILFRSRTHVPEVQAYANEHVMARLRCALAPSEIGPGGMPKSTRDLDAFEESLIGALKQANAEVYLIAVVTSEGNRDLFFAARDLDDLRAGIKAAANAPTITLQLAPIADKAPYLKLLTLTADMEKAAFAQGRAHPVPIPGRGPFGRPGR